MIRGLATVLGALAFVIAAVNLVARYLPLTNDGVLIAATASPYLTAAGLVAMLLFLAARRWVLTIVSAVLCLVMIAVQLPRFLGPENSSEPSVPIRLLTANLGLGQADAAAMVEQTQLSADVLVTQEMTPGAAEALIAGGLDRVLPYRVIDPHPQADGIGLWSGYPIAASGPIDGAEKPMLWAKLRVPGVRFEVTVIAVHLAAPLVLPIAVVRDDIARFRDVLTEVARAAGSGSVIVAGDLNSTYDMQPFRRLLDAGFRDAAEQAGAGLTRSYPSKPWRIPVVGIDHVLVRNCTATTARTVPIPGSDHRGLAATVEIPADPTGS